MVSSIFELHYPNLEAKAQVSPSLAGLVTRSWPKAQLVGRPSNSLLHTLLPVLCPPALLHD